MAAMALPALAQAPAILPSAAATISGNVSIADKAPLVTWLGLQVAKPDDGVRAQLPDLPQGIGFVVRSLDAKGPAAAAGIQAYDVIWKMDGQLLVNEGQFATLLRLKSPGDSVVFETFRGGKALVQPVVLAGVSVQLLQVAGPFAGTLEVSGESGPMRIIHPGSRTASLNLSDGIATLRRGEDGDQLEIVTRDGKEVFRGVLPAGEELPAVPEAWRKRVVLLRKGLEQALNGGLAPVRAPRQRVFPAQPAPAAEPAPPSHPE